MNKTSIVTSLALGSLLTLSGCATNSPFASDSMQDGYQNTAKAKEGSCSHSGMDKKADGSCSAHNDMDKKSDSKCGSGNCGSSK